MFLTVEDYRSVCDTYEFEQITEDQATRMAAEAAALEEISSYLRARYDMDRVFAASGTCTTRWSCSVPLIFPYG